MTRRKKRPTGWVKRFRRFLFKSVALFLALTVGMILILRWLPPPSSAFMVQQRFSGIAVDYRWVPMHRISPYAALAVIASEDQNFFIHLGIDLEAIVDAIEDNHTRQRNRGASTISQQVAKNLFLWQGHSYIRKAIEAYFTLVMELLWPKERILEVYLNIVEMGKGVFGVEAAGQRFFHKQALHLNRYESATLAAVLPNPKKMSADHPSDYVAHRTLQITQQMNVLEGPDFLNKIRR